MRLSRVLATVALAGFLAALASPAGAATLIREGLKSLTSNNELIILGNVLDTHSYWNPGGTHVLTDVRVNVKEVLKGSAPGSVVTVTLVGGQVGDSATLLIGGPELVPGSYYVLFLSRGELLEGSGQVTTIISHIQGVFDVVDDPASIPAKAGDTPRRAISQGLSHDLWPDNEGITEVPGGEKGYLLDDMINQVREFAR